MARENVLSIDVNGWRARCRRKMTEETVGVLVDAQRLRTAEIAAQMAHGRIW